MSTFTPPIHEIPNDGLESHYIAIHAFGATDPEASRFSREVDAKVIDLLGADGWKIPATDAEYRAYCDKRDETPSLIDQTERF